MAEGQSVPSWPYDGYVRSGTRSRHDVVFYLEGMFTLRVAVKS